MSETRIRWSGVPSFLAYNGRLSLSAQARWDASLPSEPRPFLATVNLTENCQAGCLTCTYWQSSSENRITTERALRLVAELEESGFRYLRFLGGEPLLRRDLFEILAEVNQRPFSRIVLATNGLLLGRFAEEVNESPITNITVSVDGTAETCDLMRGTSGYFDTVLANLAEIRGKKIKLASIATRFLADDIDDLLRVCQDRGYDYDVCLPSKLLPFANGEHTHRAIDDLWPSQEQVDQILGALAENGFSSPSILAGARDYLLHRRLPFKRCILGYTEIIIRANGDVHSGCYELGPTGNIVDSALSPILRSEATADMVRDMFTLPCSGCLIGWQTSRAFEQPLQNLVYVRRRLNGYRAGRVSRCPPHEEVRRTRTTDRGGSSDSDRSR